MNSELSPTHRVIIKKGMPAIISIILSKENKQFKKCFAVYNLITYSIWKQIWMARRALGYKWTRLSALSLKQSQSKFVGRKVEYMQSPIIKMLRKLFTMSKGTAICYQLIRFASCFFNGIVVLFLYISVSSITAI